MNDAAALFAGCVVSGILVPLPEEVPLLVAGMAIARGELGFAEALAAGAVGTLLRDGSIYGAGRLAGPGLQAFLRRRLGARLDRAIAAFEARDDRQRDRFVFATRFLPGVRAPLYLVAGLLDVSLPRFLILDTVGLAITTPLTLAAGQRWGAPALDLLHAALGHQRAVLAGLLTVVALAAVARRRRARPAD